MSSLPSSQSNATSNQPAPPSITNVTCTNHSDTAASAAALAQSVDRIAQDNGLSTEARKQLYLFAVQTSSNVESLWLYALSLRHTAVIEDLRQDVLSLTNRIENVATTVRRICTFVSISQTAMKELQRHLIVTSKTSYRNLAARAKNYVSQYPIQFWLHAYSSEILIQNEVNSFLDREAHQVRGSFRKVIFAGAVGGRPLAELTQGISSIYSNQPDNRDAPIYMQAHIAQLRLIAADIIAVNPPPNAGSATSSSNPRKRPRNDTGFWTTVDAKFKALVEAHGESYDSPGWRTWETLVVGADKDRFTNPANQFSPEVALQWTTNPAGDSED